MFLTRLEKILWCYRRLTLVLSVVLIIQFFELALLQAKYDIFTGGFLQPYAYRTFSERVEFLTLSSWYDIFLISFLAALWLYITDSLNRFGILIYYSFAVFVLLGMGIWLSLKFKLLSYFNDTINYQIITNLGGGSLKEGLLYATNEIALFICSMIVTTTVFVLCSQFFKNHQYVRDYHLNMPQTGVFKWLLLVMAILTPFITYAVSNNGFLWYGMKKKTSYQIISSSLDMFTDFDRDGYGLFNYPKDPKPFNSRIYPGAVDFPSNGVDEDGLLGDAELNPSIPDSLAKIEPRKGKHIILIVLETARVDLFEQQINGQYVAPVMREIARTGTSAKFAYSHTGYTTTSLTALFNRELIQHDHRIKLIDFLQSSGYVISIISGQDESFGDVATHTGMHKEGVYYFDARTAIEDRVFPSKDSGSLRLSEERVVQQFQTRFKELDLQVPQFIYLNFQAAHFPYSHPNMQKKLIKEFIPRAEILPENKDRLAPTYWNAIANADWAVGQIVETLKNYNLYDNTALVILADHGESLFEDGFLGHGHAINDAQTHIPLLFNDPNMEIKEAIGQIDVAEMAIRSAFDLPNRWLDTNKTVFQLVGDLSRPTLIGHVKYGGDRIIFDFRSQQSFLSDLQQWKTYQDLLKEPEYKKRINSLIREWETLKWHEFDFNQTNKSQHLQGLEPKKIAKLPL